jgi:hypothetical protein
MTDVDRHGWQRGPRQRPAANLRPAGTDPHA